jgi:hypothetical protein
MNRLIQCHLLQTDGEYEGEVVDEDLPHEDREDEADDAGGPYS